MKEGIFLPENTHRVNKNDVKLSLLLSTRLVDTSPEFFDKKNTIQLIKGKYLRSSATYQGKTNLFVNQFTHIAILFDVHINLFDQSNTIRSRRIEKLIQFDEAKIQDFRIVPWTKYPTDNLDNSGTISNKEYVITSCDNMQLYMHQVDENQGIRLVCMTDIGIDINEIVTAINICPKGKWVAVATSLSSKLTNIVLFKIRSDKFIEWQDEINYYTDTGLGGVGAENFTLIRDLDMSLVTGDEVIICAFMLAGGRDMLPFGVSLQKVKAQKSGALDGSFFLNKSQSYTEVVKATLTPYEKIKMHGGVLNNSCSVKIDHTNKAAVFMIDMKGFIRQIKSKV